MSIDNETVTFFLSLAALIGVLFSIYFHFRNPQIANDKTSLKLREDLDTLKEVVDEVKEKHLRAVEKDLKELSANIHQLALTVTRLSTVIDERIPRVSERKVP